MANIIENPPEAIQKDLELLKADLDVRYHLKSWIKTY